MLADAALRELRRRTVAPRGVATTPVVASFDVAEQVGLGVGPRWVGRAMQPLVLQAVEEALGTAVGTAGLRPAAMASTTMSRSVTMPTSALRSPAGPATTAAPR